jgi:excisionase family DNA binding protein
MSSATEPAVTPRFLSYKQASAYCGLSEMSLRRLVAAGRLRVSRPMPGTVRFDRHELDAMMLNQGE